MSESTGLFKFGRRKKDADKAIARPTDAGAPLPAAPGATVTLAPPQPAQARSGPKPPAGGPAYLTPPSLDEAWRKYEETSDSALTGLLVRLGRPLAEHDVLDELGESSLARNVQELILASGGLYGGSYQVFLAVQAASVMLSGVILLLTIVGVIPWWFMGLLLSVAGVYLPYDRLRAAAKERRSEVTLRLPDFADLLVMSLAKGDTVLSAIEFTASRQTGVVAEEMRRMVNLIRSRSVSEQEAFELTGHRLGTPEARAFMTTLLHAAVSGSKAVERLEAQADQVRVTAFQEARARARKASNKLVFVIALHFILSLFILIMGAAFTSISGAI